MLRSCSYISWIIITSIGRSRKYLSSDEWVSGYRRRRMSSTRSGALGRVMGMKFLPPAAVLLMLRHNKAITSYSVVGLLFELFSISSHLRSWRFSDKHLWLFLFYKSHRHRDKSAISWWDNLSGCAGRAEHHSLSTDKSAYSEERDYTKGMISRTQHTPKISDQSKKSLQFRIPPSYVHN